MHFLLLEKKRRTLTVRLLSLSVCEFFENLHDSNLHLVYVHFHTNFDDLDLISRTQWCWTLLADFIYKFSFDSSDLAQLLLNREA